MDYKVMLISPRRKRQETVVITGVTCAGEAEESALRQFPGLHILDISRCSGREEFGPREKVLVEDD